MPSFGLQFIVKRFVIAFVSVSFGIMLVLMIDLSLISVICEEHQMLM